MLYAARFSKAFTAAAKAAKQEHVRVRRGLAPQRGGVQPRNAPRLTKHTHARDDFGTHPQTTGRRKTRTKNKWEQKKNVRVLGRVWLRRTVGPEKLRLLVVLIAQTEDAVVGGQVEVHKGLAAVGAVGPKGLVEV